MQRSIFLSIGYFLSNKQYDEAPCCIRPTALGGDPYLHVIRANTLLEAKSTDGSAADKAIEQEPDLPEAHGRIAAAAGEKNYKTR